MARPSKLETDPDLAERIFDRIRNGNYAETAAQAEGVTRSTYYNWMGWGREGGEPYEAFLDGVTRAVAECECTLVEELRNLPVDERGKADNAQANAIKFILERTRREHFGQTIELRQKAEDTIRDAFSELVPRLREELDSRSFRIVLAIFAGTGGGGGAGEVDSRDPVH